MDKYYENNLNNLKEHFKNIEYLDSVINLLSWDMRDSTPPKGIAYRSEVLEYLAGEKYKLQTSGSIKELVDYFKLCGGLDEMTAAMVKKAKRDYDQRITIPQKRWKEYAYATSNSEIAWQQAKNESDFSIFAPHLEKQIEFKKEFINYWGYENNRYDALLDEYEPGMTAEKTDKLFTELKTGIIELLRKIKESKIKPDARIFNRHFPIEKQKAFSQYVLTRLGYDMEAGKCSESMHPYTIIICNQDVRQTTHYYENELRRGIISSIHEGGHSINAQNIPDCFKGTTLGFGPSAGINESQSRFYENMIGRSKSFWTYMLPELKRQFPEFKDITLDEFYKGLNKVTPSTIRLNSDELTYNLHIIIRYELEKAIFNEDVKANELPALWNRKYKEYLGVEPKDDADGILSDWHWSVGLFGYFPCYTLANIYDGLLLNKILKDIPDLYERIEKGDFAFILTWLRTNIYKHGAILSPEELIKKVTGQELETKYFMEYLNKKYSEIYDLYVSH